MSGNMVTGAIGNSLLAAPFVSGKGGRIDRIAFEVTTTSVGNFARVGIYSSKTDEDLYPDKLVVDGGEFDCSSLGIKSTTIDVELVANKVYWAVYLSSAVAIGYRRPGGGNSNVILDSLGSLGGSLGLAIRSSLTYQALPTTFPAGGTVSSGLPGVFFRFAK